MEKSGEGPCYCCNISGGVGNNHQKSHLLNVDVPSFVAITDSYLINE